MDGFFLAQGSGSGVGSLVSLFPIVLIILIFYFIMYRPIRQRQKGLEAMIAALEKGDRVITTGGVYGTVVDVKDHVVMLKIADQVKIKVSRSAIASLQSQPDQTKAR
jgi:preprotein translocase subunit YajC